jgi:hypothetical protein
MKDMVEMTKANEVAKEQARKKEEEEAKEAAAREELLKRIEEQEMMEIDNSEESDEGDLESVVRVLNKDDGSLPLRKRSRGVEVARKEPAVGLASPTALRQSRFVAHTHDYSRVIVEGSAKLENDDKVAQFIGLVGVVLTNGKLIDPFFVLNPVIIGGGRKDLRDVKDVPQNMTALGGYIKLSERSLQTFQKRRSGGGQGGKKSGGEKKKKDYEDLVYFTMAMSCDVVPTEILSGITVEWMRAGGVGLYRKEIQAFNAHSPFVILKLCTSVSVHTLMA